ncbi:META domain-containing protein [Lujinxingia litoralis]
MAHDKTPLLGEEWIVEDIAGEGVIDNSRATLHFLPEGRLAGRATCNRMMGTYQSEESQLTLSPAGTTMMACPEALMNQERKLMALLPKVESYRIDETGALILMTADGTTIVARR